MQNARAMGTVNGPRQDRHQQCRRTWILRSPVNPLGQRRAVHILHGEPRSAPRFAHVKDLHDVRMPELGQRLGLLPEPLPLRLGQVCPVGGQLQCHGTPQALVSGAVHHPARPSSQQRLDLVTIDLGKDAAEHRIAGVVEPGQGLLQQRGRAGVGGDRRRIALPGAVGSPLGPGQVGGQLPGQTLIKPVATFGTTLDVPVQFLFLEPAQPVVEQPFECLGTRAKFVHSSPPSRCLTSSASRFCTLLRDL